MAFLMTWADALLPACRKSAPQHRAIHWVLPVIALGLGITEFVAVRGHSHPQSTFRAGDKNLSHGWRSKCGGLKCSAKDLQERGCLLSVLPFVCAGRPADCVVELRCRLLPHLSRAVWILSRDLAPRVSTIQRARGFFFIAPVSFVDREQLVSL